MPGRTVATSSNPAALLEAGLRRAIEAVLGDDAADVDPQIRASQRPEHGDYQSNCVMGIAKQAGLNPRDLADRIAQAVALDTIVDRPEVAGPGFINFRLKTDALTHLLSAMDEAQLGIQRRTDAPIVAIDLCGVNVAKQTHVGHLRSTIIGDSLARVLERLGSRVHRENHLGDWGLPIAMVLSELRALGKIDWDRLTLTDLDRAYRAAQLACKADIRGLGAALEKKAGPHRIAELEEHNAGAQVSLEDARATLIALQNGDPSVTRDWQRLIDVTMRAVYESFEKLGVKLGPENNRGESFYRDRLMEVVDAFVRAGLAKEDAGAIVVPFPDRQRPLIIRKSDGGFLYATTDLAALRYRVQELGVGRAIYLVDARQRDHFRDVFEAIRLIGWDTLKDGTLAELKHVGFGSVLGLDGKPLRTRSGENVTLDSLLTEAIERGTHEVRKRATDPNAPTHGRSDSELAAIGQAVGIGAVKYADLSSDLVRDYVFDFERMIAFEGNTGPYLQYAHARICSIFARSGQTPEQIASAPLLVSEPAERRLALTLLRYPEAVADVAQSLEPHRLCTYLYELAESYSTFYQDCPVLKAEPESRGARLRLCDLVRRVLADGLDLLGIAAPRMM
jgi:arginyl-tRNA synthetase